MSDVKQVKVDNWGIYFLQRLKHFFNRTDFCDLTLQFQDNAQLKVHRLVLSACTEYFELLERTCEMYEDCLVMPDDLQADVVVPIVNFMYTGQLEFRMDLLEKLYQTSQIMHMPVLTKLLEAHRNITTKPPQFYPVKPKATNSTPSTSNKRSYSKTFAKSSSNAGPKEKKLYVPVKNIENSFREAPSTYTEKKSTTNQGSKNPRPTRYELPEELDKDNIFDNSFCDISYTSSPLMVHPETVKRYSSKRSGLFGEASCSKTFSGSTSTMEIVQFKKISSDSIFEDSSLDHTLHESNVFQPSAVTIKNKTTKDTNKLFDQILDENDTPKVTIDTKNSKAITNLDHAKIISEVLKKYSHILKGNKNIKLKILNPPNKNIKKQKSVPVEDTFEPKDVEPDYTYESDVIDSKQAAKLIAMGAENIAGPWICLICGTPGRALHFSSYYKFRRHLVEVHKEKPVSIMCEYCGHKTLKRNYLLHHLYSKHNIPPPPHYHFPKCNVCNYIALSESLLVKHKFTHSGVGFYCNVCTTKFSSSTSLLAHIQITGHKYSADKKNNLQCVYCLKVFSRESNLYTHLKSYHKVEAKSDGIIDDSDEEIMILKETSMEMSNSEHNYEVKLETSNIENEFEEVNLQYQVQADGNIHVISSKKQKTTPLKQRILNSGLALKSTQNSKTIEDTERQCNLINDEANMPTLDIESNEDQIVTIDSKEYIVRENQLIGNAIKETSNLEYIVPELLESNQTIQTETDTAALECTNIQSSNIIDNIQQSNMIVSSANNLNQPIQFVVSNGEEYKAIMSTNHPIIFNNSDNNKTLTVLTAPHGTTLDTAAINLDNTQSNDMMIIQQEFPLNVTENVSTDNSNIVVVYSHPVDNQNKQYQLITTQGIGAQFVPSSAIITQNYETVTTTAPIMSAHVLDTQPVWEHEVQQTKNNESLQTTTESSMQLVSKPESQNVPQENVIDNNLNELPEVNLEQKTDETVPITEGNEMNDDYLNQSTHGSVEVKTSNSGQEIVQNISAVLPTEMDTDTVHLNLPDGETTDMITENTSITENIVMVTIDDDSTENKDQVIIEEPPQPSEISNNHVNTIESEEKTLEMSSIPTYTQDIEVTSENQIESHQEHNNIISEEQSVTLEQVKNITSEWSEDESQDQGNTNERKSDNTLNDTADNKTEMEESIENIQQEVESQNSLEDVDQTDNQENSDHKSENVEPTVPEVNESETNTVKSEEIISTSNEKITSILNDWEDNDSQEADSMEQSNEDIQTAVIGNSEETPVATDKSENEDQSKPGIIKKLVSDWDDDEEEIKD